MASSLTYAEVFRPADSKLAAVYDIGLIAGFSVLIGICANIAFYLPFSPVPVTAQTFAVLMTGALLGSRRGGAAVVTYLMQGIAGLPVFSAGQAGPAVLFGPTGGYLIGFVAAAFVVGFLAEKQWDRSLWTAAAAMAIGNAVIYAFGLAWLIAFIAPEAAVVGGVFVFIPGDIIKIILAAVLLPAGWKLLRR